MRIIHTMIRIMCLLTLVGAGIDTLQAQCTPPTQRTFLLIAEGTSRDTLWFGHSPIATIGEDTILCESEYPPWPPEGNLYAVWMSPPGYPASLFGNGFIMDYRRYVSPAKVDTHRVVFQPDSSLAPITFSWSRAGIQAICDSAVLTDDFGGVIVGRTRMDLVDSMVLAAPLTQLRIYRFGERLTSVDPVSNEMPQSFSLSQNYPNPFNPSTTIQFAVVRTAMTEIAIYDILGRNVATLVSESLAPGYYSVQWDGRNSRGVTAAGGVYFVRMNARPDNGAGVTAFRKLLLVK